MVERNGGDSTADSIRVQAHNKTKVGEEERVEEDKVVPGFLCFSFGEAGQFKLSSLLSPVAKSRL